MEAIIVIPARHGSTRYPGKPLVPLRGADGTARSLLERTIRAGRRAVDLAGGGIGLYVATDDARIAAEAERVGAEVILTSTACRNGTERVAEALRTAGLTPEIAVNLQGDAPLTPPRFVTALIETLRAEPDCAVATPVLRCDAETVRLLRADRAAGRVGATTAVSDRAGRALYFSKEVIPSGGPVFHHVGLYACRPAALAAYTGWEPGALEQAEGLEQLRFLENGMAIRTVEVTAPGAAFWELNNPSDVALIEGCLARMGMD